MSTIDAISKCENADGADGDLSNARYTSIYGLRIDGDHFDPYQDMNVIVKNSQIDIKWKIGLKWKIGYRIRHPKSIAHVYGFPLEG